MRLEFKGIKKLRCPHCHEECHVFDLDLPCLGCGKFWLEPKEGEYPLLNSGSRVPCRHCQYERPAENWDIPCPACGKLFNDLKEGEKPLRLRNLRASCSHCHEKFRLFGIFGVRLSCPFCGKPQIERSRRFGAFGVVMIALIVGAVALQAFWQ